MHLFGEDISVSNADTELQPGRGRENLEFGHVVTIGHLLTLDLENLHDLLSQKSEWINIQPTIKQSVRHLLNITVQQQN